jgi:hypothetical protein
MNIELDILQGRQMCLQWLFPAYKRQGWEINGFAVILPTPDLFTLLWLLAGVPAA